MAAHRSLRLLRRAALVGSAILSSAWATTATADPQATVGLTVGVAGRGLYRSIWTESEFHLGLHGDVLFGRKSNHHFGVGPYAEVLTNGFDEIQFGGGASLLVPIIDSLPIVVSGGAYGRAGSEGYGVEPGIAGSLFFGSRSYNFSADYVMTAGLVSQFRYGLGESREISIVVGAQIDLALLSLPLVYLIDAAHGGSHETDRIKR